MILLQPPELGDLAPCPYLPERDQQFEQFFAKDLDEKEMADLLADGWRKFGIHFFRPSCPGCTSCLPLRIISKTFSPSKSQKRNLKANREIEVKFGPLSYSPRIYQIYEAHSRKRFSQLTSLEDFLFAFYSPSCPSLQSEYYLDGKLIGAGFLDMGIDSLSSVYFFFDPDYSKLGIGTFSILKEIEHAGSLGLPYYYLGYYVPGCDSMKYKDSFRPREHYDWEGKRWIDGGK